MGWLHEEGEKVNDERICDWCHENPADMRYREIIGIEELRDQGGANKVIGRRETGRIPCRPCMTKIRDGVPIGQTTLL